MPSRAPTPCQHPRCPAYATPRTRWCDAHRPVAVAAQVAERAAADARRGSAAARGYGGKWRVQAERFRVRFPLCLGVLVPTPQWEREAARAFHALRLEAVSAGRWAAFLAAGGPGAEFLRQYPIFTYTPGRVAALSEVVDHIVPHRGDPALLWGEWNWQALDKRSHDRKTARHDGGLRGASAPRLAPSSTIGFA